MALKIEKYWKSRPPDLNGKFVPTSIKDIFKEFFAVCRRVTILTGIATPYQAFCTFVNSAGAVYCYSVPGMPGY